MKKRWILLAVILLVAALLVTAPAALFDVIAARFSKDAVRLTEARGTVWRGTGVLVYFDHGNALLQTPIAWNVETTSFFTLAPRVRFGEQATELTSTATFRLSQVEIKALDLRFNADAVRAFLPSRAVQSLGGSVRLTVPALTISDKAMTGDVRAQWENAVFWMNQSPLNLGDVTVTLNYPSATLKNQKGEITLDGQASLANFSSLQSATLTLAPNKNTSPTARQLLSVLGTPDAEGKVRLTR